jgi:hypothetical protein
MPVDSQGVDYATPTPHRSSAPLLFIAWLIVGVPAAWGVTQTVKRSMDLFTAPNPAPTTAPMEATPTTTRTTNPS